MSIDSDMKQATAAAYATPGRRQYVPGTPFNVIVRHGKGRRAVWYEGSKKISAATVKFRTTANISGLLPFQAETIRKIIK